jgi:hypothetical protein
MKPRSFIVLAVLTAVFVVAAIWSVGSQRGLTNIAADRERAFPELIEKANDVASVAIVSNMAKFTIARAGDDWGLAEKGGYKVSFEKVKSAIVGLGELKLLESKTADAARYERLQVENPGTMEAKSIGVELKDNDGKVIASGVIGKRHVGLFGQGGGGTYLRRGEDALSWLAEGIVDLGGEPNDWLVRDIVNLEAEDIARAVLRQPDGAEISVTRTDKNAKDYVVTGIPEDRKLKDSSEGKNLAGGLWRLTFEDVKPAKDLAFPDTIYTAKYESFDGLEVRIEMTMVDDVVWGRFSASAENAKGDEKAMEALKKKAAEITERAKGWVYELSAGEGEKLTTKIEDILEKPKES